MFLHLYLETLIPPLMPTILQCTVLVLRQRKTLLIWSPCKQKSRT
nr:MAG TPA: hypothetical protein [Caudoviricetes sp.]